MRLLPDMFGLKLIRKKYTVYENIETINSAVVGIVYPSVLQLIER